MTNIITIPYQQLKAPLQFNRTYTTLNDIHKVWMTKISMRHIRYSYLNQILILSINRNKSMSKMSPVTRSSIPHIPTRHSNLHNTLLQIIPNHKRINKISNPTIRPQDNSLLIRHIYLSALNDRLTSNTPPILVEKIE